MINYISAELGRLSKKKSTYIYYGILAGIVAVFLLANHFLYQNLDAESLLSMYQIIMGVIIVFVGTQAFMAVYTDDLAAKSFTNILSSGISKLQIVVSKLILFVIHAVAAYIFLAAVAMGIYLIVGGGFNPAALDQLSTLVIKGLVDIMAFTTFASIISIVVYGSQNSSVSIMSLILVGVVNLVGLIAELLARMSPVFEKIYNHLFSTIFMNAKAVYSATGIWQNKLFIAAAIYTIVGVIVATIVFNKKEIDV